MSKFSSDSSSLVDLKAEVFRKRQEAKQNQLRGGHQSAANQKDGGGIEGRKLKNKLWRSKTNSGVHLRIAKDESARDGNEDKEKAVRASLEKKAKLYDELKNNNCNIDESIKDRFLVSFENEKKPEYEAEDESEEWVEYKDSLGRTRVCMRKDLEGLRDLDNDLKKNRSFNLTETDLPEEEDKVPDLLSEDGRRELLRRKWEREEEENLRKKDVHYGDVLFDEARSHGAGFYQFSRDEQARMAEKEELDKFHEETVAAKRKSEEARSKKRQTLAARLKKVRDRKRLKMGLPLKEEEENEEGEDLKDDDDDDNADNDNDDIEKNIMEGLKVMREEEAERRRKDMIREWDLGKEGVERKILSQDEWVSKKREERNREFAPLPSPSAPRHKSNEKRKEDLNFAPPRSYLQQNYGKKPRNMPPPPPPPPPPSAQNFRTYNSVPPNPNLGSRTTSNSVPSNPNLGSRTTSNFVPPNPKSCATSNFVPSSSNLGTCTTSNSVPRTSKPDPMKNLDSNPEIGPLPCPPVPDDYCPPSREEEERIRGLSSESRLGLHKEMSYYGGGEVRGRGAEVAPPTSMDYYTSTSTGRNRFKKSNVAEAFRTGLAQRKREEEDSGNSEDSD